MAHRGLDELLARRPDLGMLELTCANTETSLPTIDLAIEIMEVILAHSPDGVNLPADFGVQTTGDSGQLAAQPEHLEPAAYDRLREATYPFGLPFDLWLVEGRRYLQHMGIARHELMRVMPPRDGVGPETIATEALAISPTERDVLTRPTRRTEILARHWGVDLADGPVVVQLRRVDRLLQQAGMEYGDLVHLLTTRFVNPGLLLTVSFAGEPCAVDGARIARTDGAALTPEIMARFLERLHRFVRLQRRLGWTAYELDAALVALRVGDFDEPDFLPELAALASLSSELGMPVGELRSWWRDLDTYRYTDDLPSAYEAVYLDERVRRRVRAHRGPHRPRGHQVDRARDQPVAGGVGRSRRAGQMLSASTELFTTTSYRVTRH